MKRGSGGKSASAGVILIRALVVAVCAAFLVISFVMMVDAIAYLAGVGRPGTFTATGYRTVCSGSPTGNSCWTEVDGYVEPGNISVSWPGDAQVGDSFPVRLSLWDLGLGTPVLFNTGTAVLVGFIFGALQLFAWCMIGFVAYRTIRSRALARGSTAGPTDVADTSRSKRQVADCHVTGRRVGERVGDGEVGVERETLLSGAVSVTSSPS